MENSQELFDAFREDIVDVAKPYLWTEAEVTRYADDAYRMFVRLTGGIADFTSDLCKVPVTTGEELVDLHHSILRVMSASTLSDFSEVKVVNVTDMPLLFRRGGDYGQLQQFTLKNSPGPVRWMVVGMERNKARLIQIPEVNDEINMVIYRLPEKHIVDGSHPLSDIASDHHMHLLDWMKYNAYKKQDAETFNKTRSEDSEVNFNKYCTFVRAEIERYKAKPREVVYGGI